MVETNNSWFFPQQSSLQLLKSSCMSTLSEPRQPGCSPVYINPNAHMSSVNISMPGSLVPSVIPGIHAQPANTAMPWLANICTLRTEPKYHPNGLHQQLDPCFPNFLPCPGSYLKEQPYMIGEGHGGSTANVDSGSLQKRLVIFDQSGSHTRLIYDSVHPPSQYATTAVTELASCLDFHAAQAIDQRSPFTLSPPALQEQCDENHLSFEESEMHEDTEELNALLYSDEENDDYDDDDDDEVMSTGHSPFAIKLNYLNEDQIDDMMEEVASPNGPNKRQKLLNGCHKQSSMVDASCSVRLEASHKYDSDAESSYAIGQKEREEMDSLLRNKQSKKDKILLTLKILESLIPGAKGNNPLLVLDKSIDYLKSLKLEAETLGVNHF